MGRKRQQKYLLLIALPAAIIVGAMWTRGSGNAGEAAIRPTIETVIASTGDLERVVRVAGTTSAVNYAAVSAPRMRGGFRGITLYNLRESGEMVKKGDILAEIDSRSIEDLLDDVQANYEDALAATRKRKAETVIDIENLRQDVLVARSQYEKWQVEAAAAEIRTIVDRELLALGVEESAASFRQKQKDLGWTQTSTAADVRISEISAEQHNLSLSRFQRDLERCTILSPMDGMAVRQQVFRDGEYGIVQEGDQMRPGMIFLKVMDLSLMRIETEVNQSEGGRIRVGQKVRIGLDAYPERSFTGRVHSIGALARGGGARNNYVRTLPVVIHIESGGSTLNPDLSVFADIVTDRVENAVTVPRQAVFGESGRRYVLVAGDGGFERRPVEVALKNHISAAIESGLEEGECVALRHQE